MTGKVRLAWNQQTVWNSVIRLQHLRSTPKWHCNMPPQHLLVVPQQTACISNKTQRLQSRITMLMHCRDNKERFSWSIWRGGYVFEDNQITFRICFRTFLTLTISVFFCRAEWRWDIEVLAQSGGLAGCQVTLLEPSKAGYTTDRDESCAACCNGFSVEKKKNTRKFARQRRWQK